MNAPFPAKMFFMHLLSIVTLYASAIAFITVTHQVVNLYIPDPIINYGHTVESSTRALRTALSFLIVMFPVYVGTLMYLRKKYLKDEDAAKSGIRKFLVYMTMFVAGVTILFSLVFLINRFLDGELTVSFALKLLSILVVAGSVFGYYTYENKHYIKD